VQFAAACVHANVCRGLHRVPDSRCRLRTPDPAESRPREVRRVRGAGALALVLTGGVQWAFLHGGTALIAQSPRSY